MRNRYKRKTSITIVLILSYCITIPDSPLNQKNDCIANYYQAKRRMREIQIENRNITTSIIGLSFGVGFWTGPIGFIPLITLPFNQIHNKEKVDNILIEYRINHCEIKKNDE